MVTRSEYPDPAAANLPAVLSRNGRVVEDGFWRKLLRVAGRIPFAEDLAAAYFCAMDPLTPGRVRGVLIGALAYFVLPLDAIPDFVAGLGYTDDAAVLVAAMGLVSRHIREAHYRQARAALGLPLMG